MKLTNEVNTRVLPVDFEYYEPKSLSEAISLLDKIPDAKILAGGLDLLVWVKMGFVKPRALINIKKIEELNKIQEKEAFVDVGSAVRVIQLQFSDVIKEKVPLLWRVARSFSSVQVRTMTTVGGNICSASPASDLATAALAIGANVEIFGPAGRRVIPLDEFYLGNRRTVLKHNEVLTKVSFKKRSEGEGFGYSRIARIYDDIAKVIVAVRLKLEDGKVSEASVALGSVAPKVVRATSVERAIVGKRFTEDLAKEASSLVVNDISPIDDIRSTAEYRREVSKVLVRRALIEAWKEVA